MGHLRAVGLAILVILTILDHHVFPVNMAQWGVPGQAARAIVANSRAAGHAEVAEAAGTSGTGLTSWSASDVGKLGMPRRRSDPTIGVGAITERLGTIPRQAMISPLFLLMLMGQLVRMAMDKVAARLR
jgi:hypothetical protein